MSSKQPGELSKKNSKRRRRRESGFEEWGGYMAAKKQKLQMQFEDMKALELMDQKETEIFKGVCIFVNGHTDPPADDLKRLMLIHGGMYHHYFSSKTTHIIASNLPKSKMKLLKTKTFVKADWITDSIKAGKLLSHHSYLLYTPEVADKQQRLDLQSYFQKKPNASSSRETCAVNEGSAPENENKSTPMVEEILIEDSDSSVDSEQNALCGLVYKNPLDKKLSNVSDKKHSTSNHNEVPSKTKSSSDIYNAVSFQNQRFSNTDSSHLKSTLSKTERHTLIKNSLSNNENKFMLDEIVDEDFKSDKSMSNELVGEDFESDKSISNELVGEGFKSDEFLSNELVGEDLENEKSTSNELVGEYFESDTSRSNELFGEDFDSDCIDLEQNIENISINKNSSQEKSLPTISHHTHDSNNNDKISSLAKSSPNVNRFSSSFKSNLNKVSPLKPSLNVNITESAQNKSSHCKDSSHLKTSSTSSENYILNESSSPNSGKKSKPILNQFYGEVVYSDSSVDFGENSKSSLVCEDSSQEKSLSRFLHEKQDSSNDCKMSSPKKSSPNANISKYSFTGKNSPLKSPLNVEVSLSAKNQSATGSNLASFQSSTSNKVSSSSNNQSVANKESYSKHLKSVDTSTSPQKLSKAVKAGDPNFLGEFFNHSRKHHISTSAQELKRYVQFLVENNKEKCFPKRDRLRELSHQFQDDFPVIASHSKAKGRAQHVIMHLDMDCFFVSVGLKKHPELRGVPVAVTHAKGKKGGPQEGSDINYEASHYTNESNKKLKGVISGIEAATNTNQTSKVSIYSKEYGSLSEVASCSYEARQAGVRNGQFLGEALRRCPNLQTIPYDFEGYSEVSKQLYDIVASYTLDIEAVSCDELYIDCAELLQDVELSPHQFSSILRAEIEKETGCTASAGMGSNMLLARLATKVAKPNGQHFVNETDVETFMKQQKVGDLPGVGYTTVKKLCALDVRTCGDLQSWSLSKLQQEFGPKTGQAFYNNCRGKDDKVVQYHKGRKSVSAEVNYGIRFETEDDIYNFIKELSTEVQNRIRNLNCKGNQVTLKLMARKRDAPMETAKYMGHGVCDNYSKSVALKSSTDSAQIISKECYAIARSFKINPQDYRGVGIQLSKLVQNRTVQKDNNPRANFSKQSNNEPIIEKDSTCGIFAPKTINKVNQVIPEKSTIKHFLSNKSSPSKQLESTAEIIPIKNTSPLKLTEPSSKHRQKAKTIEHFLANKPSTSRSKPYNITDYLPEELDLSVMEALPDDLKKEILESCKPKLVESERKALNLNPSTSASGQSDPAESLHQEQGSEKVGFDTDSNSMQSELIGLDESFLNALPDDLRKEVLDSYDSMTNKKYENVASTSTAQRPTTTFASEPNNPTKLSLKKNSSSNPGPGISWSELDESVLNALPEDLKKEVLESYSGGIKQKHFDEQRPSEPSTSNQKSSKATSGADSNKLHKKKKPTLGGAFELVDVRALIKEWIDSTDDPQEEDVNDLNTFLVELCDFELNNVEILAKYLYRLALKANQKWKDVYLTVLSSVQAKVSSKYESTLMLSCDFPA